MWVTIFRDDDDADLLWKKVGFRPRGSCGTARRTTSGRWGIPDPAGPARNSISTRDRRCRATIGRTARAIASSRSGISSSCSSIGMPGEVASLAKPSIDTGMGLERLAAVAQGVYSNYDSDVFTPLLNAVATRAGVRYGEKDTTDRSMRVVADHLRAITFLMADGVCRRTRGVAMCCAGFCAGPRAMDGCWASARPFLHELTAAVVNQMAGSIQKSERLLRRLPRATRGEEERFIATLDQGLPILNEMIAKSRTAGSKVLTGLTCSSSTTPMGSRWT